MDVGKKDVKIYSRKRFVLPFNKEEGKHKTTKYYKRGHIRKIIIVFVIAITTAAIIIKSINPIIDRLCENEAQKIATNIANEEATRIMSKYNYDDLITIVKDNDNNIVMVQANTNTINSIVSEIPIVILEEFEKENNSNITIYVSSILGLKTLSATGPKITSKIANTSNVKTTLKSEFTSAGINQTLHRIYLDLQVDVTILTPYELIDTKTNNQVLLAEAVIVGNVPDSYYNLNNPTTEEVISITE